MDPGITVGTSKDFSLPPSYVGKSLKIIKPNKQEAEVPLAPDKDRASASFQENDRAGIYRLSLPVGAEKESGTPRLYAANRRFSNRAWMRSVSEPRRSSSRFPSRSFQLIPQQGGKRMDLAFPC